MSSNINPNNIDGTYPIAGQDNDSQGFRTNFTNIKNNLVFAKSEIEDLQSKVVVKSALSGGTVDNNFAGTVLSGAEIKDFRETRVDLGTVAGSVTLNHASGHYYTAVTANDMSLSFSGFPAAGKVGRIRLEITVTNLAYSLTLPNTVYNTRGIAGIDASNTINFNVIGTYVFEFTTEDGGTSIHITDLSRPRDYFHSTQITLQARTPTNVGQAGDVAGMFAIGSSYIYVCTGTYDGSTVIWKRAAITSY